MILYKISLNDVSYVEKTLDSALTGIKTLIEGMEIEDTLKVEQIEMSETQYNSLQEFLGF